MPAYALYRLPYSQEATFMAQTTGEPDELPSCSSLNGREGFVMAPFSADKQHPFLLLQPGSTVNMNSIVNSNEMILLIFSTFEPY